MVSESVSLFCQTSGRLQILRLVANHVRPPYLILTIPLGLPSRRDCERPSGIQARDRACHEGHYGTPEFVERHFVIARRQETVRLEGRDDRHSIPFDPYNNILA